MRSGPVQRLISVLCLAAFSFQAAVGMDLVHCKDSGDGARLEWGCRRDDAGRCGQPRDGQDTTDEDRGSCPVPGPCEDEPVSRELTGASAGLVRQSVKIDVPPTPTEAKPFSIGRPSTFMNGRIEGRAAAPPPAMMHIRTVVIVV